MKVDWAKLDRAFNPRCVVVVGDSLYNDFHWLRNMKTFKGRLYSVQLNPQTIETIKAMGVENYTSLLDIPGPIDLVVVAAPRAVALNILEDCIRKDVAVVHYYTSGFSETGTEEGRRLERQLAERARQANINLVGPNCMGLFNPAVGIRQGFGQYTGVSGPVGFISQSGTHAIVFSLEMHLQGVEISKSVSFGNGIVLDASHYLEYLVRDEETKVIGMYLEGLRDGARFFRVLREVTAQKPVVIWKGGRTEEGGRAIASHTGSLAAPQVVWEAAVKQCGAINVSRQEELVDTLKALLFLPPVQGDRVGITGGSGGQSVAIADVFAEAGLKVPELTPESYRKLDKFYNLIGGGYRNPVDTGNQNQREIKSILKIIERDANIDNLALLIAVGWLNPRQLRSFLTLLSGIKKRTQKPVMTIIPFFTPKDMQRAREVTLKFQDAGIPTFSTIERSARALRNALDYYRFQNDSDRH